MKFEKICKLKTWTNAGYKDKRKFVKIINSIILSFHHRKKITYRTFICSIFSFWLDNHLLSLLRYSNSVPKLKISKPFSIVAHLFIYLISVVKSDSRLFHFFLFLVTISSHCSDQTLTINCLSLIMVSH